MDESEYNFWIVNDQSDGLLIVPESCRASVIHVSDADDGEKRMAAIQDRNNSDRANLSSRASIFMYSRPLDSCDGSALTVPEDSGRNSRASPTCILLEESIYLVIPESLMLQVSARIRSDNLDRLLVSFVGSDKTCSTRCTKSNRQMSGTLVLDKSEFGILDVEEAPKSPLEALLL